MVLEVCLSSSCMDVCVAPDSEFVPHFFKTPLSLSSALDASTSFSNPEICCVVKTQIFDFPCNVCATSGITILPAWENFFFWRFRHKIDFFGAFYDGIYARQEA